MALDALALGIVPCDCGRLSTKVHCPFCGSYDIRGRALKTKRPDPSTLQLVEYQVYRCRICFKLFDDLDWTTTCNAPLFESPSAKRIKQIAKSPKKKEQREKDNADLIAAAQKLREKYATRETK